MTVQDISEYCTKQPLRILYFTLLNGLCKQMHTKLLSELFFFGIELGLCCCAQAFSSCGKLGLYSQRRQWHPTPVLLPRKSHGRRSLVGCSSWGRQSRTRLSDFTFTFHFHALEKEMATHSSILAWRIPGRGSLVGCRLWGRTESDTTEATQQQQQQQGYTLFAVCGLLIVVVSFVVEHGLQGAWASVWCTMACRIFPDQGGNPCPLPWQMDSY